MTDFKNIKHFNCSLDLNLTHLLTVRVMLSSDAFLEAVNCFSLTDDIDVESVSKYVAGKHRTLTTMNISGSRVIHIVIVVCLPSVWHLSSSHNHLKIESRICFKSENVSANAHTILVAINKRRNIRILMNIIRLTNGKHCRCYYTCGYMIFWHGLFHWKKLDGHVIKFIMAATINL